VLELQPALLIFVLVLLDHKDLLDLKELKVTKDLKDLKDFLELQLTLGLLDPEELQD
jgi:hypothetical protein